MGGTNIVITSNLPTTDGRSYASNLVEDPGIAVWWIQTKIGKAGQERVLACDRWLRPTDNLHAINKSLDAMRGMDRWGAQEMVERAFSGFAALPSGDSTVVENWRDVFNLGDGISAFDPDEQLAVVKSRYKRLASKYHPDITGDSTSMIRLNAAMEQAEKELA